MHLLFYILLVFITVIFTIGSIFYYKFSKIEIQGSIKNIKKPLIIFDFDGTLCDSYDHMVDSLNSISSEFGLVSIAEKERLKLKDFGSKNMLQEMGIRWYQLPFVVKRIREVVTNKIPTMKIFNGTVNVLQTLKEKGFLIGILTSNSMENVQLFLKNHGIEREFDFIYSGSSFFGKEKHLISLLKNRHISNKKNFIYVGDETRDILAAKNANFYSIGVTWGFNSKLALEKERPDLLVQSWDELVKGINGLL